MEQFSIVIPVALFVLLLLIIFLPIFFVKFKYRNTKVTVNPIDEAKVYIYYGRIKQAKNILKKQLEANPHDREAIALLNEINSE